MRRITIAVILAWMLALPALACDVCGCSASANFLGILPQYDKHFIGLSYRYQSFTSTHPEVAGETRPQRSQDHFQSITAWGRFYPFKRVQVFVFAPYHYNYVKEEANTTIMNGLGDITLSANYLVLNTGDSGTREWLHNLFAGAGIKIPTGKNSFTNNEGIILSNMQPGTGSWDILANINYTLRYRSFGLNAEASYQLSTVNNRDYRYGNKLNTGLAFFSWQRIKNISLLPQVGVRMQQADTDLSSYTYNITNPYSGGTQWYAATGIGCYFTRVSVTGLCNIPFAGNYAHGLVTPHVRYEMQIQYLF